MNFPFGIPYKRTMGEAERKLIRKTQEHDRLERMGVKRQPLRPRLPVPFLRDDEDDDGGPAF